MAVKNAQITELAINVLEDFIKVKIKLVTNNKTKIAH